MSGHSRALLAEAAGTFWFIFIGAGAIIADANGSGGGLLSIALANGLALAVAVSAFGGLSGAHFNPAVTLALAIIGRHPWSRLPTYWIAQLAGGLLAGVALRGVFDFALSAIDNTRLGTPALANGVSVPVGIGIEAILTIFLVWAVYGTVASPPPARIAGLGIGLAVATGILMGGTLTGAAMNPARHVATAVPAVFFDNWYVYWIGPLLGAAIAALSIRYVFALRPDLATPRFTP
jgi:MIP family channel proteins